MFRSATCVAVFVLTVGALPATAQEKTVSGFAAPSAAVAAAWAKEAAEREITSSSTSLKVLYGSYGVLQGLDMYSTIVARERGAREVNPIMDVSYAQASIVKSLLAAGTVAAAAKMAKKNRKAAVITMIAVNVASAAVVANNFRNARRLR